MADRLKPKAKDTPAAGPDPARSAAFVSEIGQLVRRGRARRGLTRRQLAGDSGISERYLAQIESGQGNPSVIVLKAIADVFEVPVYDLVPLGADGNAALTEIFELLSRVPQKELPEIAATIRERVREGAVSDRANRIALVGLRGAGKSTLGKKLAERLKCPFVELNRVVEQEYGASVPMLIEMSGVATFRRYERACLEKVIEENEAVVIATAGGIVSSAETYALLLRRTHTVWVKAAPQDHMGRVIEQGDFRPMAQNREAMADLVAILEARRNDYAQAEAQLETSGDSVEESTRKLEKLVKEWTP